MKEHCNRCGVLVDLDEDEEFYGDAEEDGLCWDCREADKLQTAGRRKIRVNSEGEPVYRQVPSEDPPDNGIDEE